ncbi:MAG: hypothetical protein KAR35_00065 [Candidatus Heimdallarchaeota archaeon]|nr:hypothetical protein [Candidatus Heimdallarchaeota archaeon]MCK5047744.1 hypothetical protein [Candidatus Heimdallarchaeota archaeon]
MMNFCEECGAMLTPKYEEERRFLYCNTCKKEISIDGKVPEYSIKDEIRHQDGSLEVIEGSEEGKKLSEEEREMLLETWRESIEFLNTES